MAPNLRPTLSTRIRASFDGKGGKSTSQKPQETNTFVVQDAATLRDAIGQAISNDSFQNAIAAHLARLIEPSIKDALDTIQPVVETVYQHDILLRKTNRSVEDLLQRFDSAAEKEDQETAINVSKSAVGAEDIKQVLSEHSAQNNAKFEELSGAVREGHTTTAQTVIDIAKIKAALSFSSQSLASLESFAHQSTTDNFKLQEQLGELKADIGSIMKSMETQGSALVGIREAENATSQILSDVKQSHASHALTLNEIKAHDQSFRSASIPIFEKTHADTATAFENLTANLAALKENMKASFASENDSISGLGAKVDKVLTSVETVSGKDSSPEILAAVQRSNEFHTIHVTALEGIMDRLATPISTADIPAGTGSFAVFKEQLGTIANTLDSHSNHLTAIRDGDKGADILSAVRASNESHAANGADLGEIRAATKVTNQSHASYTADLSEIKKAILAAAESHASHDRNFGDLQAAMITANESHASNTTALESIKVTNDNSTQGVASQARSLEALGTQMDTVIATLGSQSIVHSDIRDTVHASQEAHISHSADLGDIKEAVRAAGELHTAHAVALDGMKTRQDGTVEQLVAHTTSLNSVQEQVGTVISNFGEQTAIHSEIRDALQTSKASHDTHAKALEEIAATNTSSNAQLAKQTTTLDTVSSKLNTLSTALDQQSATHSQLLEAVQTSNASHTSHTVALDRAQTAHADILGGVSESRGLLTGHNVLLASHGSLLESVKDAHSKSHADVIDAVKQSHGLLESQAGTLRGMEDKHDEIRDSVQALGGGVHLNENGLNQLKDYVKAPSGAKSSELAPEVIQEPGPLHSLLNGESTSGLGMATIAGGGLLAVAGNEGLFSHGSENENSMGEPTTSVERVKVLMPEHSLQDSADPSEEPKTANSVAAVTKPAEDEKPLEPEEEITEPAEDERPVESAEETTEHVKDEKSVEPIDEITEPPEDRASIVSTEETSKPVEKMTEQVEDVDPVQPVEEVTETVEDIKSIKPINVVTEPVDEVKPVEPVDEEAEPTQHSNVTLNEPAQDLEPANGDQVVNEPTVAEPIVEDSSTTELAVHETTHDTSGEELAQEKRSLNMDSASHAGDATGESPSPDDFASVQAVEPGVEKIRKTEVSYDDYPIAKHPALESEEPPKAMVSTDDASTRGTSVEGPPSMTQSFEHSVQKSDGGLEEPAHDTVLDHTVEVLTISESMHDEPVKEPEPEDNDSLEKHLLDSEPNGEESAVQEPALIGEAEPGQDTKSVVDESSSAKHNIDITTHQSEIPVEIGHAPIQDSVHAEFQPNELEHAEMSKQEEGESVYEPESATIAPTVAHSTLEPESAIEHSTVVPEPVTTTNITGESLASEIKPSQVTKTPEETEHPTGEPTLEEPILEEPIPEESSVKRDSTVEDGRVKQSTIDTFLVAADELRIEDPDSKAKQVANVQPTLEEEPSMDDPISQDIDVGPAVMEEQSVKEEKTAAKAPQAVQEQEVGEIASKISPSLVDEPVAETKVTPEDLATIQSASKIPKDELLHAVVTKDAKEEPFDTVEPMVQGASHADDIIPTSLEKVEEAEPLLEPNQIKDESSLGVEFMPDLESEIDVKKNASESKEARDEPTIEKIPVEDQIAGGSALKTLLVDDQSVNSNKNVPGKAGEAPLIEPLVMESAMRTRTAGAERRPSLMKRVSFKEPPAEVNSASENGVEAEPDSTRETIIEEQHDEAGPIGDESVTEEPSGIVQHKVIAAEDEAVLGSSHIGGVPGEGEPDNKEHSVENVPLVASELPTEKTPSELEPSNHQIPDSSSKGPLLEPEQKLESHLSTSARPDLGELIIDKPNDQDLPIHDSSVQLFTEGNFEGTHVEAKPTVLDELTHVAMPDIDPATEHGLSLINTEGLPSGGKISDPESAAEDSRKELEESKDFNIKPDEGTEASSNHHTVQDSASEDRRVQFSDKTDLTQHDSIPYERVEEAQNKPKTVDEPITESEVALTESPPAVNNQTSTESDESSMEKSSTDKPATSDPSNHEHALDHLALDTRKDDPIAGNPVIGETKSEAPVAATKDLAEEAVVGNAIVGNLSSTEEPLPEMPVAHISSLNDAVIEEPSNMETKHEEHSTDKSGEKLNDAEMGSSIDIPTTASYSALTESTTEEPALHEQTLGDVMESPTVVSTATDEPAVPQTSKEETGAEIKDAEERVIQHPLTGKPPGEIDASSEALAAQKTPTEESSGTELLQEAHSEKADTSTYINATETEIDQSTNAGVEDQDDSTVKESTFEGHALEKKDAADGQHDEAVTPEDKAESKASAADHPANEIQSTAKDAGLQVQASESAVEDIKPVSVIGPTSEELEIPVEDSGETERSAEERTEEIKPANNVVHTPESNDEPTNEEKCDDQPISHKLVESGPHTDEPSVKDSVLHDSVSDEPTDHVKIEDPNFIPPLNIQPLRVDSGIDVETPTDIKSASKTESLDTLVENPVSQDTLKPNPSIHVANKESFAENSPAMESNPEVEPHKDEVIADATTTDQAIIKSEPTAGKAKEELQDAAKEPLEENQLFDAVDKPANTQPSTEAMETGVKTSLATNKTNGNPVEDVPLSEPMPEMHGEKELQVDTKQITKEQHTRVDSGIEVDTPVKEPLGKLQSVVEVKPSLEIESGLEGGMM